MIVLKIALRNLVEHKVKTAIIGFLIAFAIAFLVIGNSVMDGVKAGMRDSYAANFTGDLIVHGIGESEFSLFPSPGVSDTPVLPAYRDLRTAAETAPGVAAVLPLVAGAASVSVDEEAAGMSFLWGVDFREYRAMFPGNLTFIEGGFPEAEGSFALLSERVRSEAEKKVGRRIAPGDKITLGGIGSSGNRLREATVAGIFKFVRGGEQLDNVSLIDAATARSLKGMTAVSSAPPKSDIEAAPELSEEELFSSGSLTESGAADSKAVSIDFDKLLGDLSVRDKYAATDTNAWNFLLIRLSEPSAYPRAKAAIDSAISGIGAEARADDWRWGAGMVADLAYSLQIVFNVIVLIVSIVAVIIIMNTLVISVTERIPEIGTIRAIGGPKGFVRSMIVWETLSISIVFGLVGIAIGAAAIGIANYAGIESSNMFFALLFGGPELRPTLSASAVAWSVAATASIGTLSSLYPTAVALKISPVRAMQKA